MISVQMGRIHTLQSDWLIWQPSVPIIRGLFSEMTLITRPNCIEVQHLETKQDSLSSRAALKNFTVFQSNQTELNVIFYRMLLLSNTSQFKAAIQISSRFMEIMMLVELCLKCGLVSAWTCNLAITCLLTNWSGRSLLKQPCMTSIFECSILP